MDDEQELEFRQIGDTWLHVMHRPESHGVRVAVINESTQQTHVAELTTAMARHLRDWLNLHYPRLF